MHTALTVMQHCLPIHPISLIHLFSLFYTFFSLFSFPTPWPSSLTHQWPSCLLLRKSNQNTLIPATPKSLNLPSFVFCITYTIFCTCIYLIHYRYGWSIPPVKGQPLHMGTGSLPFLPCSWKSLPSPISSIFLFIYKHALVSLIFKMLSSDHTALSHYC